MNRLSLIDQVKPLANARPAELLARLGVPGQLRGGYLRISDPMSKDRDPSLVIWHKAGTISFKRYGGIAQGDVIDLVAYLNGWFDLPGKGRAQALRWLEDFTGIRRMTPEQRTADRQRARRKIAEEQKRADEKAARARAQAFNIFTSARPIAATLAETYLAARGINLGDLPQGPRGGSRVPASLRFAPALKHINSDTGCETAWPAMIAACVDFSCYGTAPRTDARDAVPEIRAIHRTYLARDGRGKAPVADAKKVWPAYAGCVIQLWRGAGNLSIGEAIKHGVRETLVLTEGIEDGLSAVLGDPSLRVWAAISLSNLGSVPVPECVDGIIVHRQNDWGKQQAVAAFERAIARLEATGRPVVIVEASGGKDLNDTLRGET